MKQKDTHFPQGFTDMCCIQFEGKFFPCHSVITRRKSSDIDHRSVHKDFVIHSGRELGATQSEFHMQTATWLNKRCLSRIDTSKNGGWIARLAKLDQISDDVTSESMNVDGVEKEKKGIPVKMIDGMINVPPPYTLDTDGTTLPQGTMEPSERTIMSLNDNSGSVARTRCLVCFESFIALGEDVAACQSLTYAQGLFSQCRNGFALKYIGPRGNISDG